MKFLKLLILVLCCAAGVSAQDLRPSCFLGKPGKITIRGGKIQGSTGGVTTIAQADFTPTVSATTYYFLDLTSTPVVSSNTTGFPTSNYFPMCQVAADANGTLAAFVDQRPDYFMAGGGSGSITGSSTGAATTGAISVTMQANCPTAALNVTCFQLDGTKGDWQYNGACSWPNASGTVTCPSGTFVAGDVGKRAFGTTGTNFTTFQTGVCAIGCLATTTIQTFTDSAHVTLSVASTAVSVANSPFYWGTNPSAGGSNADAIFSNAATALGNTCSTMELPVLNSAGTARAIIPVITAKFQTIASRCTNSGPEGGGDRAGFKIHGGGMQTSEILMLPEFDPATCPAPPGSCFSPIVAGVITNIGDIIYEDFSLNGGGDGACGAAWNGKTILEVEGNNSEIRHVSATGKCASTPNGVNAVAGIRFGDTTAVGPIRGDDFFSDGFGFHNCVLAHTQFVTFIDNSFCGDSVGLAVWVQSVTGSGLVSIGNNYGPSGASSTCGTGGGTQVCIDSGANMLSIGDVVTQGGFGAAPSLKSYSNIGGTLTLDGVNLTISTGGADNLFQTGGTTFIKNSQFVAVGAASVPVFVSGGKVISHGGNTFTAPGGGVAIQIGTNGAYFGNPTDQITVGTFATIQPTCTVTGAGATATCAVEAQSTNERGSVLVTAAGAGPAANGTVVVTFGIIGTGTFALNGQPVACTWTLDNTGNTAWNARATVITNAKSTTATTINWDNNAVALVAANTVKMGYNCTPR